MTPFNATEHLDDAMLVRHLDDRAGDAYSDARAHLVTCRSCLERLERVRQRSDAFSAALDRAPVAPLDVEASARQYAAIEARLARRAQTGRRASVWRSPWIRAAAGIVIIAGIAAAAPPVRAWITSRVSTHSDARQPDPATHDATPAPPLSASASEIYFTIPGPVLTIAFAYPQSSGDILVTRANETQSSASVIGGAEELVVLPDGIRVRNQTTSSASYLIRAGKGVERVRVQSGARDTMLAVPDSGVARLRR